MNRAYLILPFLYLSIANGQTSCFKKSNPSVIDNINDEYANAFTFSHNKKIGYYTGMWYTPLLIFNMTTSPPTTLQRISTKTQFLISSPRHRKCIWESAIIRK